MNMAGTDSKIDTPLARERSRVVRYELIDKDGGKHGPFYTIISARAYAEGHWPDQSQDPDRTGRGWDIAVVGAG